MLQFGNMQWVTYGSAVSNTSLLYSAQGRHINTLNSEFLSIVMDAASGVGVIYNAVSTLIYVFNLIKGQYSTFQKGT